MRSGVAASAVWALVFFLTLTGAASAQSDSGVQQRNINLGDREAGRSYWLALGAENKNCPQPLDFRFTSKTSWLKMPPDPVVRQVPAGQTRQIQATLDLSNVAPGQHEAFVDVDCENCGFLIFKNCRIDKQQLRLAVNVIAAAGGGQPPVAQQPVAEDAPQIDYDDKRIPKPLRNKAKAADAAWQAAVKKKTPCEEELERLRAAAAAAQEKAEKAKQAADTAEQDARNAKAQEEAAQEELKNANKESVDAQKALDDAEKALKDANKNGTTAERNEAKDAVDKAKAAKDAADKRVADAAKAAGLHTPKELSAMEKDAEKKRKAADKAAAEAKAAADAVAKKEAECAKLQAEADAAKAAKDKADAEARAAIPVPAAAAPPTPEEIAAQRKKLQDCADHLGRLLEAQRLALEAMAKLGALGEDYESDLESWANAVDKVNDLFDKVPPGIPVVSEMVGTVQDALTAVRAIIGIARAVTHTGNLYHIPKGGEGTVNPEATKKWLQDNDLAGSPEEASDVYDQMNKYSKTNSTEGMQKELEAARDACKAEEEKLDKMENAAKAK